jgi:type I restriction enzyme S subunit
MTTTYLPYPAYQPSGIDWLGNIPSGWKAISLRHLAKIKNGSDFKHIEVEEGGYPVLGSGGEFARVSAFMFDKPSVLLGRKGTIDNPLYIEEPFWTVDTLFYTEIQENTYPKFFYYFCKTIPFSFFQYGSTVPSMTQNDLYSVRVSFPSLLEQQQIAAFLDRETAKIDQLIAKQQQLIELLKEKRQAVISHAVTKGVNPDVKMNPSGVEWLGDVPEHWTVCALKHAWHIIDCKHLTAEFVDDGIPLASIREVQAWEVDLTNAKQTTPEFYAQLIEGNRKPEAGDIIYSRNATVGESAKVTEKHPVFSMGQDVCIFKRKSQSTNTDFFLYQIRSQSMQQQLDSLLIGSTFKRINVDNIRNFTVTVPPATEQQAISDFITQQLITFNQLLEKAQRQIELLRERRAALISAAVTGKIDVREVALLA